MRYHGSILDIWVRVDRDLVEALCVQLCVTCQDRVARIDDG